MLELWLVRVVSGLLSFLWSVSLDTVVSRLTVASMRGNGRLCLSF